MTWQTGDYKVVYMHPDLHIIDSNCLVLRPLNAAEWSHSKSCAIHEIYSRPTKKDYICWTNTRDGMLLEGVVIVVRKKPPSLNLASLWGRTY